MAESDRRDGRIVLLRTVTELEHEFAAAYAADVTATVEVTQDPETGAILAMRMDARPMLPLLANLHARLLMLSGLVGDLLRPETDPLLGGERPDVQAMVRTALERARRGSDGAA